MSVERPLAYWACFKLLSDWSFTVNAWCSGVHRLCVYILSVDERYERFSVHCAFGTSL